MSAKTILIVEDNLDSRQIYGEILRDDGFKVVEAEHGKEALEYLKKNPQGLPHLIIMDLTFPLMTAKEFVQALKAQALWNQIPFFVVSGQVDTREQSIELGARGFMRKPFDMEPFIELIKNNS
jgi:CheY-like chemotaxis protein